MDACSLLYNVQAEKQELPPHFSGGFLPKLSYAGSVFPFDFAFQLPLGPLAPLSKRYDKTTGYRPVTRPSIKILFNISLHILILPTRKPLKLIFLVLVFFSITSSDPACPRDRITVDSSWNRKVRKIMDTLRFQIEPLLQINSTPQGIESSMVQLKHTPFKLNKVGKMLLLSKIPSKVLQNCELIFSD